jgi:hypothetical protein
MAFPKLTESTRLRSRGAIAGFLVGLGSNVVATQIPFKWGMFLYFVAVAIWLYDTWPVRRAVRRFLYSGGLVAAGAVLIFFVAPLILEAETPILYYGDRELNGQPIKLVKLDPNSDADRKNCLRFHTWSTKTGPVGTSDSYIACGIWMRRPKGVSSTPGLLGGPPQPALYVDLSQDVTVPMSGFDCHAETKKPELPYLVRLKCPGVAKEESTRWLLGAFHVSPVPSGETLARVTLEYGQGRTSEASFTILPPD